MIEFKNVSFQYNETDGNGIFNINLTIKKGEFVLLSGRSGCGKTTLTRCVNGLIPHFYEGTLSGTVLMKGQDVSKLKLNEMAETVGSVFQDPRSQFFTTDTVSEVAFACENAAIPQNELIARVDTAIEDLNIHHLRGKSIFELSSGERQRIAIASVHALSPEIYVFDEPSANLDAKATEELAQTLALLKQKGATVIISEHRLYYLKDLIDKVVYMESGRIMKEYNRKEFQALSDLELASKGLRCLSQERLNLSKHEHAEGELFLRAEHLCFDYKKNAHSLFDVNFEAAKGNIIGVIGHNGAGKSTLAEVLCGLLREREGSVFVADKKASPKQRIPFSYFIMQDAEYQLFSESVADELTLGLEETPEMAEQVNKVLEMLNLTEYRDRHPASLSGGQKQRVVIAAAYMRNLKVVVFDEPTSGLDRENMKRVSELMQEMAQKGMAVFVITHDYELLLNVCQRILRMEHGKIEEDYTLNNNSLPQLRQFFCIS